jgi:hypothetical protein
MALTFFSPLARSNSLTQRRRATQMEGSSPRLTMKIFGVPPVKFLTDWGHQVKLGSILGQAIRTGIHVLRSQRGLAQVVRLTSSAAAMLLCTPFASLLRVVTEAVGIIPQLII